MTHSRRQRQGGATFLHGHVDGVLRPSDDWRRCEGDGKVGCEGAARRPLHIIACVFVAGTNHFQQIPCGLTSDSFPSIVSFSNTRRSITKCPDEFVEVRSCLPRDSSRRAASPARLSCAISTLFSHSFHAQAGPGHER